MTEPLSCTDRPALCAGQPQTVHQTQQPTKQKPALAAGFLLSAFRSGRSFPGAGLPLSPHPDSRFPFAGTTAFSRPGDSRFLFARKYCLFRDFHIECY
jgi:hypothetical protein